MIGNRVFCYAVAKVFKQVDHEIDGALGFVSGHSLKHLISGASGAFLLLWLMQRESRHLGAGSADRPGEFRPGGPVSVR